MKTFSESWYRVADQRIALRPNVAVRRQIFRGERWYVVHDPFANQFFRVRPAAYEFLARLGGGRTVREAWEEAARAAPDEAPGQEEAIRLLAQLHHANLLRSTLPGDTAKLFERYRKRRSREFRSKLASIMFFRIPLIDPDDFLRRTLTFARWAISPFGALVWLGVVALALKLGIDRFGDLWNRTEGVLAPANLPLLYLALVFTKTVHEFGHAWACRRFGGEVHTMGIMFLIFTPVPYMDATASWAFRSRAQRIFVAAAGMIAELFVAALALIVWANTGGGALHAVAYNVVFIASVSTLLFNLNPLLRFDGYYILCDLLDMPNLHGRAARLARHLVERHGFGYRKSTSPADSRRETAILGTFFVASNVYKVVLFAGILLFVADRFLLLGLIMAALCLVSWIIRPLVRLVDYLATSPRLARTRTRAVGVTLGSLAALVAVLGAIPMPRHFLAPGIVEAEDYREVFSEGSGFLAAIDRPSGRTVRRGDPLVTLENRELDLRVVAAEADLVRALAARQRALGTDGVAIEPFERRVAAARRSLELLRAHQDALVLRAPVDGTWVAPELDKLAGTWIARGASVGHLVQHEFRFAAVVPQQEAATLFTETVRRAAVRVAGQAGHPLAVASHEVIPAQQELLPSPALGWLAGGEVATTLDDGTGLRAAEPFFEVRAHLAPDDEVTLHHGISGRIRFTLDPEPLLHQWLRKLRQLVQQRYRI